MIRKKVVMKFLGMEPSEYHEEVKKRPPLNDEDDLPEREPIERKKMKMYGKVKMNKR